jgi:hypothetical protein
MRKAKFSTIPERTWQAEVRCGCEDAEAVPERPSGTV